MERDGFVEKATDPGNRRSSLISLTDDAIERIPASHAVLRQGSTEMTEGISVAAVTILINLLQRVLRNVEAIVASAATEWL